MPGQVSGQSDWPTNRQNIPIIGQSDSCIAPATSRQCRYNKMWVPGRLSVEYHKHKGFFYHSENTTILLAKSYSC